MEALLHAAGVWLARAYALYGLVFLAIPFAFFLNLLLLGALVWAVAGHVRQRPAWPRVPLVVRRWVRLAIEIEFGLINPVLYLAVLVPSLAPLRSGADWLLAPLQVGAWILLVAFWTLRIFGAALDLRSDAVSVGVRTLLWAALAWVLIYTVKDARILADAEWARFSTFTFALNVLRVCPFYLIPAVLLWDYARTPEPRLGLFLLPGSAARLAVAGATGLALVTFGLAAHHRSDSSVRKLVSDHRDSIRAAATSYDVDPRLVASIVYVTHRDQLTPFRGALERFAIAGWASNLRRDFGMNPPDGTGPGADENPMLNLALDISVGLAQIKPRTAMTASVLATGRRPDEMARPSVFWYRDGEPLGEAWILPAAARTSGASPIPVPAERQMVASVLLNARSNLAMCALILSLYQKQWDAANRDWSIRTRPDILATLYQIGFARSKPHPAPRSNSFGTRVRQVYEEPWLADLLASGSPR